MAKLASCTIMPLGFVCMTVRKGGYAGAIILYVRVIEHSLGKAIIRDLIHSIFSMSSSKMQAKYII